MKNIADQKAYAIERLSHFLEELKKAENPFDVEASVFTIMRTAERSHREIHILNSDVKHECHPDDANVFEQIFGNGL